MSLIENEKELLLNEKFHPLAQFFLLKPCDPGHKEILRNNDVNKFVFADNVQELLKTWWGKNRNLIRTSPSISGKTFILNPINNIFHTVHLVAPKSHFAQDIILSGDIPIFATSLEIVQFVGKKNHVQGENAMMAARWKEKDLEGCARCFSELIFTTAEI